MMPAQASQQARDTDLVRGTNCLILRVLFTPCRRAPLTTADDSVLSKAISRQDRGGCGLSSRRPPRRRPGSAKETADFVSCLPPPKRVHSHGCAAEVLRQHWREGWNTRRKSLTTPPR